MRTMSPNTWAASPKGRALRFLGALVATVGLAIGMAGQANAVNIVTNGGFELGNFTGWALSGNIGFTGVQCPGPGLTVREGNCSAFLGSVGSDGTLSQTINGLHVGQGYLFQFSWLTDGGIPSDFSVSLGGVTLLNLTNPAASVFHNFSMILAATSATENLVFSFRNDPGFLFLDAVSLSVPEPATVGLLGIGLVGLFFARRRKAQ
jgi:PEP-CTERM motif